MVAFDVDPEAALGHVRLQRRFAAHILAVAKLFSAVGEANLAVALFLVEVAALVTESVIKLPATAPRFCGAAAFAADARRALPLARGYRLESGAQAKRVVRLSALAEQQVLIVVPLAAHDANVAIGTAPALLVDLHIGGQTQAEAMVALATADALEHWMLPLAAAAAPGASAREGTQQPPLSRPCVVGILRSRSGERSIGHLLRVCRRTYHHRLLLHWRLHARLYARLYAGSSLRD